MPDPDPLVIFRRSSAKVDRAALRAFALELRDAIAKGRDFTCLITNDRELHDLNRQFRHKDYPTDVLTFSSGDIAISYQRAALQAREQGHSVHEEICILMLHGLLHLIGMDHETDNGQMRRAEARWRRKLNLPASLIERAHA